MRILLLGLVLILGLGQAGGAARPELLPDETTLVHNSPPTVEQQASTYGQYCWNDSDPTQCVTNTGPCVWDPDDSLTASVFDGEWTQCLFADWSGEAHGFLIHACRKPEHGRWATPLYATVSFDPNGPADRPYRLLSPQIFTDVFAISRQLECVSGCVRAPQYDRELDAEWLQQVPYQGGGGDVLGIAVPTTVKVESNGTITVKMTLAGGVSGCDW